jgi:hypothetical protein
MHTRAQIGAKGHPGIYRGRLSSRDETTGELFRRNRPNSRRFGHDISGFFDLSEWHVFRSVRGMRKRRPDSSPFALTTGGQIVFNAAALGYDLTRIAALAPRGGRIFVGLVLSPSQGRRVAKRLDDAAAEVAARLFFANKQGRNKRRPQGHRKNRATKRPRSDGIF